jgi:alkylhydroperoxidase family enzyme
MSDRFTSYQYALREGVLNTPGAEAPALRQSVEALAARLNGGVRPESTQLPEELAAYVKTVALHAYRVTDEQIEALRLAGYSDEALFEITISAALGAGMARFEEGLDALKGAIDATQNA